MLLSKLFGKTLRQAPAEADTISHQLLLRAGMIQQLAAGVYSMLPLGWRVLLKIEQIIREEMEAAGGQEVMLPVLQPIELWEESGRLAGFGETIFRLRDRRDRELCLGPTHEEVITDLARHHIRSYRDLPVLLFQLQTKFRDEPRPRGGLIRVREFIMKDLYSFDADEAGLDVSYQKMMQAYRNIYVRCGLSAMMVEADSGAIGGKFSHEFMVIAESGENEIIFCSADDYAANAERAEFVKTSAPSEALLPVEEVDTPGITAIEDLAKFLSVPESKTLKAVFYIADGEMVFVVIRGDLPVNEVKLKNALKATEIRLATPEEVRAAGLVAGSASPIGIQNIKIVADDSITLGSNFVAGANKHDTHLKNVNYPRDFKVDIMKDIALARAGDSCVRCGSTLFSTHGIEVGHIFKLGTVFSEAMGATYLDKDGGQRTIVMGSYGIGVGRLLAAAIEQSHDDKGIVWPMPIAPYHVYLCALGMDNHDIAAAARKLYNQLQTAGVEVLFDDREESPGVKFNDADLLGIPLRVTISQRTLKASSAELKRRTEKETLLIDLEEIIARVKEMIVEGQKPLLS